MKKLLFTLGLCGVFFLSTVNVSAQTKETRQEKKEVREKRDKTAAIKQAQKNVANIESLNFSFYPNSLEPEFGVSNPLTGMGDYYFTVDKTNFYMNLPYIGRFYVTPMNPENVPINLTCSQFLYSVHSTDGINIQVTIIPSSNDITSLLNDGIRFVFNLNKNTGYAKLVVTSDNRQEMTYTGSFN
ncbi:DUF4251 domain-containing protein [Sphingobacterium rhinopitheci]|uniref:DUF4251 domain-containing protein n=1 Tax=Sphingobacterium rhinopitheci TaxID=2781960 RepID=UPI001F51EDD7|nr:DUF4251 domain-containing protein [Sphingobacterium rhinopitheci]MCI0920187.1 DUF4251 domain-containing protein [Sphingobacterium rhinopitheci]